MKSYRYVGEEAEALGNRLDHARKALQGAKSSWSKTYWAGVEQRLLFQWKQLPILHDADAQVTIIPRWHVDYEFYERGHLNEGFGISDRVYHKLFRQDDNLDASWHAHREKRLSLSQ